MIFQCSVISVLVMALIGTVTVSGIPVNNNVNNPEEPDIRHLSTPRLVVTSVAGGSGPIVLGGGESEASSGSTGPIVLDRGDTSPAPGPIVLEGGSKEDNLPNFFAKGKYEGHKVLAQCPSNDIFPTGFHSPNAAHVKSIKSLEGLLCINDLTCYGGEEVWCSCHKAYYKKKCSCTKHGLFSCDHEPDRCHELCEPPTPSPTVDKYKGHETISHCPNDAIFPTGFNTPHDVKNIKSLEGRLCKKDLTCYGGEEVWCSCHQGYYKKKCSCEQHGHFTCDHDIDRCHELCKKVPTPSPTATSTSSKPVTSTPSSSPSTSPSISSAPSSSPSSSPSLSSAPSSSPSDSPSVSVAPSASPSDSPSISSAPSASPSDSPSVSPAPSSSPSDSPSISVAPSASPSDSPSISVAPSSSPSDSPSVSSAPSSSPSDSPSISSAPSASPSSSPSVSSAPSSSPSASPSISSAPSASPSDSPSVSSAPSSSPSSSPSISSAPSTSPSASPSVSSAPSASPSDSPSISVVPSASPSSEPSSQPSLEPTFIKIGSCHFSYIAHLKYGPDKSIYSFSYSAKHESEGDCRSDFAHYRSGYFNFTRADSYPQQYITADMILSAFPKNVTFIEGPIIVEGGLLPAGVKVTVGNLLPNQVSEIIINPPHSIFSHIVKIDIDLSYLVTCTCDRDGTVNIEDFHLRFDLDANKRKIYDNCDKNYKSADGKTWTFIWNKEIDCKEDSGLELKTWN